MIFSILFAFSQDHVQIKLIQFMYDPNNYVGDDIYNGL